MNGRLKILRKNLKLSQEVFGERLGVTKASISRLESGINNLTDQMVNLICRTFSVNEVWFRSGAGEMYVESDNTLIDAITQEYQLGDFGRELLRIFVNMTPGQRAILKSAAYFMFDAVQKNENLYEEFLKFHEKEAVETAQEPAYGTIEWAEREAESYKQELLYEAQEKTSVVSLDVKEG